MQPDSPIIAAKRGSGDPPSMNVCERFGRIQRYILSRRVGGGHVQPDGLQAFVELRAMRGRSHDDAGITCGQPGADEVAQRLKQEAVGLVELNDVLLLMQRAPIRSQHRLLHGAWSPVIMRHDLTRRYGIACAVINGASRMSYKGATSWLQ